MFSPVLPDPSRSRCHPVIAFSGSGAYDVTIPGLSQLLLQNGSGDLAYGSYRRGQATFSSTSIGRPGSGWSVTGRADYNTWYRGNDQVLLQAVQNGIGTVWAYQSQLPSFTLPSGFTAVGNGTGSLFGTDLPATLIANAGGTLGAVMQGGMVTQKGVAPSVSITRMIGTLGADDIVGGVSAIGNTGTAAILVQNGSLLSEWMVHQGVLVQTQVLGAVPSGATVAGFTDVNGDAVPDVLMMTNTGTVEAFAWRRTVCVRVNGCKSKWRSAS